MEWQPVPSRSTQDPHAPADPRRRHQAALERQDDLVQQLAVAKYALSVADMERTMTAIDAALDTARRTLSDLLEVITPPQSATYGGKLLRNAPAAWDPPAQPTPDQTRPGQPTPVQPGPDRTRRDQPMPAVVAPID